LGLTASSPSFALRAFGALGLAADLPLFALSGLALPLLLPAQKSAWALGMVLASSSSEPQRWLRLGEA